MSGIDFEYNKSNFNPFVITHEHIVDLKMIVLIRKYLNVSQFPNNT